MAETRRLEKLVSSVAALADFPNGDLVVALSGGPDSAALALLGNRSGKPVRAIHVDHDTRHADAHRRAAMSIGELLGIDVEVIRVELEGGGFSEERARKARYEALLGSRKAAEWVITGHTRDDQAETVLMNLIRGTGPTGLAGIPPRTDTMVARPLLGVGRSDTRELATLAGLPFVDDPSNEDPSFTRNALRLSVIPTLESGFNPGLVKSLARAAELLRRDVGLLDAEASLLPVDVGKKRARVARGVIATAPRPLADRALRHMVSSLRPPHGPSSQEMDQIWAVIDGDAARARLGRGLEVRRVGAYLEIGSEPSEASEASVFDLEVGHRRIGRWALEVARFTEPCRTIPLSLRAAIFPPGTLLTASLDAAGEVTVAADGEAAWIPGLKRLPVAFYETGSTGYLSVFASEEDEWR